MLSTLWVFSLWNQANHALKVAMMILPIMIGCAQPQQNSDSQLNWGVFNDLNKVKMGGLLSLAPHSRVCVTGFAADQAIRAIRQWTDIIGRTAYLKVENCLDTTAQNLIRISNPQEASCEHGNSGETDSIANISICNYTSPEALNHTLLHETGHMWGLCDQYDGGKKCQWGPTNPNTIMGALNPNQPLQRLTPDDIEGIKAVTSSNQIPANQAWMALTNQSRSPAGTATDQPQPIVNQPMNTVQPPTGAIATSQDKFLACTNREFCSGGWGWNKQGQNGCNQGTLGWQPGKNGCSCRC